jgi:protein-tyrosine phosphatase
MHQIPRSSLWLGHVGDVHDVRAVLSADILAVVDLAANEPPVSLPRELLYCRFPLVDGAGNAPWLLRAAVETVAGLLRAAVPTLVYCSAGMSRSPAVAAAALAAVSGRSPEACLAMMSQSGATDVSPGLWQDLAHVRTQPDSPG